MRKNVLFMLHREFLNFGVLLMYHFYQYDNLIYNSQNSAPYIQNSQTCVEACPAKEFRIICSHFIIGILCVSMFLRRQVSIAQDVAATAQPSLSYHFRGWQYGILSISLMSFGGTSLSAQYAYSPVIERYKQKVQTDVFYKD